MVTSGKRYFFPKIIRQISVMEGDSAPPPLPLQLQPANANKTKLVICD
jgi:hypothetical protein